MEAKLVKKDLWWVGVFDEKLRVFDIVMTTPYGTTYNSYLLHGTKYTVLFETAKATFHQEYEQRIADAMKQCGATTIDYIVLNHTEPDHSGSLQYLLDSFPNVTILATAPALANISHICHRPLKSIEVTPGAVEGEPSAVSLDVGGYKLRFVIAPFLHWPDTMLSWIVSTKDPAFPSTLVPCDFFGSHYCNDKVFSHLMNESIESVMDAYWTYYSAIFGPFPKYVRKGLEYVKNGPKIDTICCSHGPVLHGDEHLKKFTDLYFKWSEIPPLEDRVVIAYVSAYGYTKQLAESICEGIKSTGVACDAYDLVPLGDKAVATALEKWGNAKGLLLGTPTIVGEALPQIWGIATALNPIVHQDRYVGVFGSYGWSGEGVRNIQARVDQVRVKAPLDPFEVVFKPTSEDLKMASEWGNKFARAIKGECINERKTKLVEKPVKLSLPTDGRMRRWKCIVCGEVVIAALPPSVCAACGASQEAFVCLGLVEDQTSHKKTDFAGRVVVVGAGAAGIAAVKAIRENNDKCSVTLISSESEMPYYRPMLNKLLVDPSKTRSNSAFYLASPDWYATNKIELLLNTTVTAIDPAAHTVTYGSNTVKYDKLILATGGNNFVPASDMTGNNVFGVRTVSDVDRLHSFITTKVPGGAKEARVAIIGGGLSALETAAALHDLGVQKISIIEMMPRILPRQLTEEGSRLYQAILAKNGITLHLGGKTRCALKDCDGVTAIELANGTHIPTDIVTFSVGTCAETSLAKLLGLKVERAVVVAETMEVEGHPDIYSCGDCSQFKGCFIPTWTVAIGQGRTAGLRAVGAVNAEGALYKPVPTPYFIDAFCEIFCIGDIWGNSSKTTLSWPDTNQMIELFFNKEKALIGAVLMGACVHSLQTPITMAITNHASFNEVLALVQH